MILGFAHLAVNTSNIIAETASWTEKGYKIVSCHHKVLNHIEKKRFLDHYQPYHEIKLLRGEELLPLELTFHGEAYGRNLQMSLERKEIHVRVQNPEVFKRFLVKGLGFCDRHGGALCFRSRFSDWSCAIRITEGHGEPVRLDATGPTCLAFYSNRIEEDVQQLAELGATDLTNIFTLKLDDRVMSIAMMRSPGGPLIELIKLRNKLS